MLLDLQRRTTGGTVEAWLSRANRRGLPSHEDVPANHPPPIASLKTHSGTRKQPFGFLRFEFCFWPLGGSMAVKIRGKRYKEAAKHIPASPVTIEAAFPVLKQMKKAKFDESVNLVIHLGIDAKQAD